VKSLQLDSRDKFLKFSHGIVLILKDDIIDDIINVKILEVYYGAGGPQ